MVCTVGLHLVQLKALTGSWRSGLNEFVFNAMKRVSVAQAEGFRDSSSENLLASLEFGVDDALANSRNSDPWPNRSFVARMDISWIRRATHPYGLARVSFGVEEVRSVFGGFCC